MPFRTLRLGSVLLPVLAACQPVGDAATALNQQDRAAIEDGSDQFVQAVRAGDWDALGNLYTEDAVVLPPNEGVKQGRSTIREFFRAFPPITEFELNNVAIDGRGDLAFVQGTYRLSMQTPDGQTVQDRGKYIEIRRRQPDGRWLIERDIFNSDMPVPGATTTM